MQLNDEHSATVPTPEAVIAARAHDRTLSLIDVVAERE
jgi:hypothetical protein